MIHTYIGYAQMVCWDDACPQQKPYESSRNATLQHMEATMEHSELKQKSGRVVSFGQWCMRTLVNTFEVSKMPDVGWHNISQRNSPHVQSPSWIIRRLGHWLHGTIPKVLGLRVHTGGSRVRIQVGGSITMQSCWHQTCPEDVPRSHLPTVWNSENGHKWWRVTLHWQDLPKLPRGVKSQAQHCHSIPPTNKRSSRNIQ